MPISAKYLIRITLAAGLAAALCAALLLASPGSASGGKTQSLRFFDDVVAIQVTKADGTVVTTPPFAEPVPGDTLDVVSRVFRGDHTAHSRRPVGTNHLRCVFGAGGPPACVSHVALGSSMLVVEGNPGKIVLGTGRFLGATGRVLSINEVGDNDSDAVIRITRR